MRKFLLLTCGILMSSSIAMAEDCANGAGTIVTGATTGYQYCRGNNTMNWWNAVAWCDSLNKKLFDITDCNCSDSLPDCKQGEKILCPELTKPEDSSKIWAINTHSQSHGALVILSSGLVGLTWHNNQRTNTGQYPLCK